MKILVLLKFYRGELNPFDGAALESALEWGGDITVLTMAPQSVLPQLEALTRLGVKAYLVSDQCYSGSDTQATSYILAEAVRRLSPDVIFAGRQSVDGDTAQVGPMVSKMLGINLITNAMNVSLSESEVNAKTRLGEEKASLPALVTVERGYVLRFPSIFSKVGEVICIDNTILCCDLEKCGLKGSPTRVVETFENEKGKRKCKFISLNELPSLLEELNNKKKTENAEFPVFSTYIIRLTV